MKDALNYLLSDDVPALIRVARDTWAFAWVPAVSLFVIFLTIAA